MDRGLRGARKQALHNFPIFQHCSPVQSLQLSSWLFMTIDFYTKTTLHTATTLPPVTIICFEIWNLIMMVALSMVINESSLFYWRWKLLLFNALWRHKLQRRHIRNRLIRVRKGGTFHWCIDCGKYCCLICRGRKLLGWPSYLQSFPHRLQACAVSVILCTYGNSCYAYITENSYFYDNLSCCMLIIKQINHVLQIIAFFDFVYFCFRCFARFCFSFVYHKNGGSCHDLVFTICVFKFLWVWDRIDLVITVNTSSWSQWKAA